MKVLVNDNFSSPWTQDVNWMYIRRPGRLLNVLCTFHLRPMSKELFTATNKTRFWLNVTKRRQDEASHICQQTCTIKLYSLKTSCFENGVHQKLSSCNQKRNFPKFLEKRPGKVSRCIRTNDANSRATVAMIITKIENVFHRTCARLQITCSCDSLLRLHDRFERFPNNYWKRR